MRLLALYSTDDEPSYEQDMSPTRKKSCHLSFFFPPTYRIEFTWPVLFRPVQTLTGLLRSAGVYFLFVSFSAPTPNILQVLGNVIRWIGLRSVWRAQPICTSMRTGLLLFANVHNAVSLTITNKEEKRLLPKIECSCRFACVQLTCSTPRL